MSRSVVTASTDQSIRVLAYNASGAAITGEAYNSAGIAVSVVVRSAGRILSTTALTLVARSGAGVHTDSAFTEVGAGEYVVDLPDSYFATANRQVSVTLTSTAISGGYVLSETLDVGVTAELDSASIAAVNAQVVDALSVDTYAELSSPPAATSSLKDKITWMFMMLRNKVTQTATQRKLHADDNTTVVGTEAVTDDGTTYTKGKSSGS